MDGQVRNNKIAQRLITCTKLEFDKGRISRAAFDQASFAQKNRTEILSLLTVMATRLQAVVRRFLVRLHVNASDPKSSLPSLQHASSPHNGGENRSKKKKKKTKKAKSPTPVSNSPRRKMKRRGASRGTSRSRSRSKSPRPDDIKVDENRVVSRALFAQNTPSEKDYMLQREYDYHALPDDHDEDGDFNFYQYEYPLRSPSSPPKSQSPRPKSSYADANIQNGAKHGRSVTSTGNSHVVPQERHSPQRRVRTAEQDEKARAKRSLIAEAYFPPVDKSQVEGKRQLLLEIQSIKNEMSQALENFQSEMEHVKHSIVDDSASQFPERSFAKTSICEGGLLEEGSKEDSSSSVVKTIKKQSNQLTESVEGMRSELLAAREEVRRLRGQVMAMPLNSTGSSAELENDQNIKNNEEAVHGVEYTEAHGRAAMRIQKGQRERHRRNSSKAHIKKTIKRVKKSADGAPMREALDLALSSGSVKLAGVVIRRSFEIFQDQRSISGFSLMHEGNISLICHIILAFLSIEEVATFGLQLLSLVSLQQGFKDCHAVMGAVGACDVIMAILARYTDDNTMCMQALMLAICLTNTCAANRLLLTAEKYCSVYGTLLSKDRRETEEQFVIDKTVRLLFKLTSDGPDVVTKFNPISQDICEQIVNGLHDHLRTPLFSIYCKTVVNMCSHKNTHMKEAFAERRYSQKYVESLNVYKDDPKTFKIVANMIILICGDLDSDALFYNIVTEYFVSTLVGIVQEAMSISEEVVEVLVILLHKLSSRHFFAEALCLAGVEQMLHDLAKSIIKKPSALCVKITLLLALLEKFGRKTPITSPKRKGADKPESLNTLLPKKNILQAIHECYKMDEFTYFLTMSVQEGRDSVALQTLVRLTALVADKRNNWELAAFLLEDIQPILDILQAFTAKTQVQVLGINLIQLLQIDYSGQITEADAIRFLRTLNIVIWGHFSSEDVCDKYLDFVLMATSGAAAVALREFVANVETFAALKNIMSHHLKNRCVFLKCCQYVTQLSISNDVRTMILAAGINDVIVEYMHGCEVFDESTADIFHETVFALCDGTKSTVQTHYFSSDESASLYLHLLQNSERNGRIWAHVLKIMLLLIESRDLQHRRGLQEVNYAATLSRGLHSFVPEDKRSLLLVESIIVFLMGVLSAAPILERRFINVDTANFVAAITSKAMKRYLMVSDITLDSCNVIKRLMQTIPIDVAVKDLSYYYIDEKRMAMTARHEAVCLLQRNLRRLHEWKLTQRKIDRLNNEVQNSLDFEFFKMCLLFAVEKGSILLAETILERLNDLLDIHAESQELAEQTQEHPVLSRLSHAPGIILVVMSNFLSLSSLQFLCLRIMHLLPYMDSKADVSSSKDIKPHIDVFFVSLLRHMNDNVLCAETLDCLIFLTTLCESNVFNASTHVGIQVISFFLKNRVDDVYIMNKLCQFVFNMCKNITNHAAFGECKSTYYIFYFLANNTSANDVVSSATAAIAALCGDGVTENLQVLASCSCLKTYYSILRRNPRNVEIQINIGKMLVSFTTGTRKDVFMRNEFLKSRLPEELQSMLRMSLKTKHQAVAACLLALTVHFLHFQTQLREQFEDIDIGFVMLEFSKPEWNEVVRSLAQTGLNIILDTRKKPTFALINIFGKKKDIILEVNYYKNVYRIRCQSSLKVKNSSSKVMKEKTLYREQSMVDNIPLKKGLSTLDIEMGSWFNTVPSQDQAATIITHAARMFLKNKAAAAAREEEERRLPILKQMAEVSTDPEILLECLRHSAKWGRLDLALVVTRRVYVLKTGQQDGEVSPQILGFFEKLTSEPDILVDILNTFTSMQVVQRQVMGLLRLFPFDEKEVGLMADMGTCDTIYAISLRHPSNLPLCIDCIKTLSYFASISPTYRQLLCKNGPMKILIHIIDKHEEDDEMLANCFDLVIHVCKDFPDNQAKFSDTKLSLQLSKFMVRHAEHVGAVSTGCTVVKALCEDGELSNLEQYFTREYLTMYHGLISRHQSSKIVVRQIYFILMLAVRCTGPYEDYLTQELVHSDAADFLVRTMLPEAQNRESQAVFFLLLIITCTYLRAVPAIIPTVLRSNFAGILTQYLDPFWNDEVQKSTKYCLRILNSWTQTNESSLVLAQSLDYSVGGDSTFLPGSIAFDDSVSVLTQDASDFNIKRNSDVSLHPTNSLLRNRLDSQQIHEEYPSDLDNPVSEYTNDARPDDSSLASKLIASENDLEKSFSLLQHTVMHMSMEPTHTVHVLNQISRILNTTDMVAMSQKRIPGNIDGKSLVCEVFPAALYAAMKAFPSEKIVLLTGCKVLQSFRCDSIPEEVADFGALIASSLTNMANDVHFCERMMKYCVHFSAESDIIKGQFSTTDSIKSFLTVMKNHNINLDILKLSFRLILHICGGGGEVQTLLSVGGVGEILMKILMSNYSNREIVSLISKTIMSLCMNENLANIYDFGSYKNIQSYFFIIKANAQDVKICSSMSFVVLGLLSIGKKVLLESLQRHPFSLQFKELLSESNFSVDAAEVIVMLASKVICNFTDFMSGFIHVNIIADLTLYSVGHWNEATRSVAKLTIRKLEEYSSSLLAAPPRGELNSAIIFEETKDDVNEMDMVPQVVDAAVGGSLVSLLSSEEPPALYTVAEHASKVPASLGMNEATGRIGKFLMWAMMKRRTRSNSISMQDVDITNNKIPLNKLLEMVVLKGRIHLAVGVMKKILMNVQSSDKGTGHAVLLASDPSQLLRVMAAFMSIDAVCRDGLLILRALSYTDESMAAMSDFGVCGLLFDIVQRYAKTNMNMSTVALKTLSFFAKGNVRNRFSMPEKKSLGLVRVMQKHASAQLFMVEALQSVTELCIACPKNNAVFAESNLIEIVTDFLVKFKLDKECVHAVLKMYYVFSKEANAEMIRKIASRHCLVVLFQFLRENITVSEVNKKLCSILMALVGEDLDYFLTELVAGGAASTLCNILRNEFTYRHNPELMTPVFTLMVHYVYNIPLITLELYRTEIPVTLEIFRSEPAWSECRKAADIILSKIKIDVKHVETERKKLIRKEEKQKSQKILQRQTSIPDSGIGDWDDLSELFSLLHEGITNSNVEDIIQVCQQVAEVCRLSNGSLRNDKRLFYSICKEYVPALLKAVRTFPSHKMLALVCFKILESFPYQKITPDIANLGHFFMEVLQTHVEDVETSIRLLEYIISFMTESSNIRGQLVSQNCVLVIYNVFKRYGNVHAEVLELCVAYISQLCQEDKSNIQTLLCKVGISKLVITQLIDTMNDEKFVHQLAQLVLLLCEDGHGANMEVFACPATLKLFLHIVKSSPTTAGISDSIVPVMTNLLHLMVAKPSHLSGDLGQSSFVLELCAVLNDHGVLTGKFDKSVVNNILSLTSYIVREVDFLRNSVESADILSALCSFVEEDGDVINVVRLESEVVDDLRKCISALSSSEGQSSTTL